MVYHILSDGSRLTDISGHVVKIDEAEAVYKLIHNIESRPERKEKHLGGVSNERRN